MLIIKYFYFLDKLATSQVMCYGDNAEERGAFSSDLCLATETGWVRFRNEGSRNKSQGIGHLNLE